MSAAWASPAMARSIDALSSGVSRSSGSSFIVQDAVIGSSRTAKFHWSPKPWNARCTTVTPRASAMSTVASLL